MNTQVGKSFREMMVLELPMSLKVGKLRSLSDYQKSFIKKYGGYYV